MDILVYVIFVAVTLIAHNIILAIYRITLHPLARIPGPKPAAITKWYEFYMDTFVEGGGRFAFQIERLHKKYGPVIRLTPHEVHVADRHWMKTFFGRSGSVRHKDPAFAHLLGNNLGTFGTVDHHLHRTRRSATSSFFSKKSVTGIEPRIRIAVNRLSDLMQQCYESGQSYDGSVTYLAWATDATTSYIFDRSTDLLGDPRRARDWWKMFDHMRALFPILKQCPWIVSLALDLPVPLLRFIVPRLVPLVLTYKDMQIQSLSEHDSSRAVIRNATSESIVIENHPNIFRSLLASSLPDSEKRPHRLAHEGFEVLVAGGSTLSRVSLAATYHVLSNKAIHDRLRAELEAAFPDPAMIPSVKDMENVPYLNAIVKESLRITKIITYRSGLIAPTETLQYGEHVLPSGTIISMTQSNAMMDPDVYPDPQRFVPERWLDPNRSDDMDRYFVPFGMGSRMCLGLNFATAALYALMATIFRRFDLELVNTIRERDIDHSRSWFIGEPSAKSPGVKIKVTRVDPRMSP